MLGGGTSALRIDFLLPDRLNDSGHQKQPSNSIRRNLNQVLSQSHMRKLKLTEQVNEARNTETFYGEEATARVKNLLMKAKMGSFNNEELGTAALNKKSKKLENISKELFDTEKRYMESLRILNDISTKVETIESEHRETLRSVFKEIPSLYMLHEHLDTACGQDGIPLTVERWVEVFTSARLAPFFNMYKAFLSRVLSTYKTLLSIYDKDKPFKEFCQAIVLTSCFKEQQIQDVPGMYIGIHSRLSRVQMMLEKIFELLPAGKGRSDCGSNSSSVVLLIIVVALQNIKNILKSSEDEVQKNEMIIRALVINEKLEGRKNHLDKLALFVRSGPCLKLPRRSVEKRPLTRHLFLFSDFLIITEPEHVATGRYAVKSELTVVSIVLEEPKHEDGIPMSTCFRVRAVECVVELMFANEEEKLSWWKSLEDTIEQEQRKNDRLLSVVPRQKNLSVVGEEWRAAEWVKDEQATMCALCYRPFTHIRRKHHCRACGKIFCRHCSNYTTKIEHLGTAEHRVCEVDFYRLNPNLKPKTAAEMERLARFSDAGPRYVPYYHGYLMWTAQVRGHWPRKKTHLRVEYSAGLVLRDSSPYRVGPSSSLSHSHLHKHSATLKVGNTLAPSSSTSQSHSPFVVANSPLCHPSQWNFDFAQLDRNNSASSITVPLPAARLTQTPLTSRVFCVLHPDTLLAMYAAKQDAKPANQLTLLGTRLIYLVRIGGDVVSAATSESRFPEEQSATQRNNSICTEGDGSSSSMDSNSSSLRSETRSSPSQAHIIQMVLQGSPPQRARVGSVDAPQSTSTPSSSAPPDIDERAEVAEDCSNCSFSWPTNVAPVSDETLAVLINMNGFILVPGNTDKMGHYFEAPNEEFRNAWIQKIKNCVVDFGLS